MKEFWFTLAGGATIASPIAYLAGRWGLRGLLDRLGAVLDDPLPSRPLHAPRSHVHVIREAGGR